MDNKVRIIPSIGYQDAKTAIQWLCEAFGFQENAVYETEDGKIAHAQLTYKGNMIMLGSSDSGSEYSKLIKHPRELGGYVTQSPYILIDDAEIESHYEQAKKQGAEILLELKREGYGGLHYTCKDPEGHLWNFGSYDPWRQGD